MEARIWTISADRTKTGREHRIPLSEAALAVLENSRERTGGAGLLFPTLRGRALSSAGYSKLLKENEIGAVPHGMRSSFRSWAAEAGILREVAEAALGHAVGGVEGRYQRSDMLEARRECMESWGRYLAG